MVGTEGNDDERHLEALEQHTLEGDRERVGVKPRARAADGAGGGPLLLECRLLVVERLVAAGPQDRLSQPLQPEDQQQAADDDAKPLDRDGGHGRAEHGHDDRERERRGRHAPERRAPPARHADGQHDREGLDRLHRAGEEGCEQQGQRRHALTLDHSFETASRRPTQRSLRNHG